MSDRTVLTLAEYELVKTILIKEFDRELAKIVEIDFLSTIDNQDVEKLNKRSVKEKCGLKLYAEIYKMYSDYNSYGRYTSTCMEYISKELSINNRLLETFLNISHEVGILVSTEDISIERLSRTLQNGFLLISVNPHNENNSIIVNNVLSSFYMDGKVLDNFFKDNFLYIVITLILSYFNESIFYKTYNDCYKGKNE